MIDNAFLVQSGITVLGGGAVSMIVWLLKRQVIDRSDRLESKLDALTKTVSGMVEDNASEHRSASDRISVIEGHLGIKATHKLKRT